MTTLSFDAEQLKVPIRAQASVEPGKLYLYEADGRVELIVGVKLSSSPGEKIDGLSAAVVLTGRRFGELVVEQNEAEAWRVAETVRGWSDIRFVLDPDPSTQPAAVGSIGILKDRQSLHILVEPRPNAKPDYLDLVDFRIKESGAPFRTRFKLVRLEHPALYLLPEPWNADHPSP